MEIYLPATIERPKCFITCPPSKIFPRPSPPHSLYFIYLVFLSVPQTKQVLSCLGIFGDVFLPFLHKAGLSQSSRSGFKCHPTARCSQTSLLKFELLLALQPYPNYFLSLYFVTFIPLITICKYSFVCLLVYHCSSPLGRKILKGPKLYMFVHQ